MKTDRQILAWKKDPEPDGTVFSEQDLMNEDIVIPLFDACEVGDGVITADGWQFLVENHGIETLLEFKEQSGWYDEEAPLEDMILDALNAGYNPIQNEKGDYDEDTGIFIAHDGMKYKVDWDEIRKF